MRKINNMICLQRGLTASQIKMIALVTMSIDHIASYLVIDYYLSQVLHIIGRASAPLFLFLLVESTKHTSNKVRYCFRLYIFGVITALLNGILEATLFSISGSIYSVFNIFPALFYTALFICTIDVIRYNIDSKKAKKAVVIFALIIIIFVLSYYIHQLLFTSLRSIKDYMTKYIVRSVCNAILPLLHEIEYFPLIPVLGILWFLSHSRRSKIIAIILCSIYFFASSLYDSIRLNSIAVLFSSIQWCMILSCPVILLYNGDVGTKGKWIYYIYYPLHQYLLQILSFLGFVI